MALTAPRALVSTDPHVVVADVDEHCAAVRRRLTAEGATIAVVVDRHQPIGIVTVEDLEQADDEGRVGSIVDKELVFIEPGADDVHTLTTYKDAAWRSLRRRRGATPFSSAPSPAGEQP